MFGCLFALINGTRARVSNAGRRLVLTMFSTVVTFLSVMSVSIFLYIAFYYAYMPPEVSSTNPRIPVHFEFDPCDGDTTARCSFLSASFRMFGRHQLIPGQSYRIGLYLELPDYPVNQDIGMFMACMNITGKMNTFLSKSCKSSPALYRSPLLKILETVTFWPFLVSGWCRQEQNIHIEFFHDFRPDPYRPVRAILVELKSRLLQVTSAELRIEASLYGLRYLMYRRSWISTVLGISSNVIIISAIISMSWTRFYIGNKEGSEKTDHQEHEPVDNLEVESKEINLEEHSYIEEVGNDLSPNADHEEESDGSSDKCLKWL